MPPRKPLPEPVDEIVEPDVVEEDGEPVDGAEPDQGIDAMIEEVRSSINSWWCPNDDTSMPHTVTTCPKCGFIRP